MTKPGRGRRPRNFDFPWLRSRAQLDTALRLLEDSLASQRQRAEQLTREIVAGTVTQDTWSEAIRDSAEEAWKGYAAWWRLMTTGSVGATSEVESDDEEY